MTTIDKPTWNCPLCSVRCAYGTRGCDNPLECDEPKNINWYVHYKPMYEGASEQQIAVAIGIAAISNEDIDNG